MLYSLAGSLRVDISESSVECFIPSCIDHRFMGSRYMYIHIGSGIERFISCRLEYWFSMYIVMLILI